MDCSNQADCQALVEKVNLWIDGSLDCCEESALIAHLKNCPKCLDELNIARSFKALLFNSVERKCISEKCKDELLNKISLEQPILA